MPGLKPQLLALVMAGVLAGSMAVAQAQPAPKAARLTVDALVRYFDTIVFGAELGSRYANRVIAKWPRKTITLSLERRATKEYLGFVKKHVAALTVLTGIKFSGTKKPESANIRMFFMKRAEMAAIRGPNVDPQAVLEAAMTGGCYFLTWKKPDKDIVKGIIVVDVERDPALTNSCLLEELTQSLGLPNDSNMLRPSIFSDRDHLTELSIQDKVLVKTLYDPRMKAGLPRAEALKVARIIISEMTRPAKQSTSRGQGG